MAENYLEPIVLERADPWIYKHTDGYYYFTGSKPGYQEIELRRAKTLKGLADGEVKVIWTAHAEGSMSELIWAPEIHFIQGNGTSILLLQIMEKSEMICSIIGCLQSKMRKKIPLKESGWKKDKSRRNLRVSV